MIDRSRRIALAVLSPVIVGVALAACSGPAGSTGSTAEPSGVKPLTQSSTSVTLVKPPKVTVSRDLGIEVKGKFGQKPSFASPASKAPLVLQLQVVAAGAGPKVGLGQVLIANYKLQTWGSKSSKPAVVDDSFARGTPVAAIVGAGQVVKGWDGALIGQRVGSRVLLTLPADRIVTPTNGQSGASQIAEPMVMVVDILGVMARDAAATGKSVALEVAPGMPVVKSQPGKRPEVTSVEGIRPEGGPSQLLVDGEGAAIVKGKTLILQTIQIDAVTRQTLNQTWGGTPMLSRADELLARVPALSGSRVGSRALAVLPAVGSGHAQVLVVDVISQL
jgi:FKBP-type peptidyl-prolyl cis-trans isomerase